MVGPGNEEVTIRSIPDQRVIYQRILTQEAQLGEDIQTAFAAANGKIMVSGGSPNGKKFIQYHILGAYDPNHLEVIVCVPVAGLSKAPNGWKLGTVKGCERAACLIHRGPYHIHLKDSYQRLCWWLEDRHLAPAGLLREVYLHEPFMMPPELLETEIICPLPEPEPADPKMGRGRLRR